MASPDGASREVFRRCLRGELEPLIGEALYAEYESLLARSEPFERSPIPASERAELWAALASRCVWVRVYYLWRPNLIDEADNHLIELAVAGGAKVIVTHNVRDFHRSQLRFPDISISTPGNFPAEQR